MDTMTATQVAFATVVAGMFWRKIQFGHQNVVDGDDIKQICLLETWLHAREHPDLDWDDRQQVSDSHAWTRLERRCIDHLRTATGQGRKMPDGTFERQNPRSLDEPLHVGDQREVYTLGDVLPDRHSDSPFEDIEDAHDIAHAFATHSGSAREQEVAWLHLEGYSLAAIGAHYGVTEARACQLRKAFVERVREDWREADWYAEHGGAA